MGADGEGGGRGDCARWVVREKVAFGDGLTSVSCSAVTGCPPQPMQQLFDFAGRLRYMSDDEGQGNNLSKSAQLSTRQLIRIGRRLAEREDEDLWRAINRACLGPFLPMAAKQTLEGMLAEANIAKPKGTRRVS